MINRRKVEGCSYLWQPPKSRISMSKHHLFEVKNSTLFHFTSAILSTLAPLFFQNRITHDIQPHTSQLLSAAADSHIQRTVLATEETTVTQRLPRREVRASRRLYAGGGSCLRDLWRAWRVRDCQSTRSSEKWWGA